MKCPQCGKTVEENYRFCPSCRFELAKTKKSTLNQSVEKKYSFVTSQQNTLHQAMQEKAFHADEQKLASDSSQRRISYDEDSVANSVSITKHKAIWRIMPGEVCHHINEQEFAQYDTLQGIIIEQGVSAVIVVDGKVEARLSGGVYNFVENHELDLLMREKQPEEKNQSEKEKGLFRKVKSFFVRLFTSKKVNDGKQVIGKPVVPNEERKNVILRKMMGNVNVSIYLMLEREFPAIFGCAPNEEGKHQFVPMPIRARNMDAKACVSLGLAITDAEQFIVQYMVGRSSLLLKDLQQAVMPYLARIMRNEMARTDISENGIPAETITRIEQQLTALDDELHGFAVVRVVDINCQSEAFERFRQLSQEMYCSEKELEYLRRTNDFKNRLATVENEQRIGEAQTDFDIFKALEEINKDRMLYEEELKSFCRLVSRERRIAEATDEVEIENALNDIEKTKLLNVDEMDALRSELQNKKFRRDNVSDMMRMESLFATEKRKAELYEELYDKTHAAEVKHLKDNYETENLKHEHVRQIEKDDVRHDTDLMEEALRRQHMTDDYKDNRWKTEREHALQSEYDKIGLKRNEQIMNIELEKARIDQKRNDVQEYQNMAMSVLERMETMKRQKAEEEHRRQMEQRNQEIDLYKFDKEHETDLHKFDKTTEANLKKAELDLQQHVVDTEADLHKFDKTSEAELRKKELDVHNNLESKRLENESHYTADQIEASRLDAEGAKEVRSSRKELEMRERMDAERRFHEERLRQQERERQEKAELNEQALREENERQRIRESEERMFMMRNFFDSVSNSNTAKREEQEKNMSRLERMATHRMDELVADERRRTDDMESMRSEYREEAHRMQQRVDDNQKQSLDYTSRISVADKQPTQQPAPKKRKGEKTECPNCHAMIDDGSDFCPHCGSMI